MPIIEKTVNLDDYYNSITSDKIVVNDVGYYSSEGRAHLEHALMTVYNGDTIIMAPSCDCGNLTGGYRLGDKCPTCGTRVSDPSDRSDPIIWLRKLDDMPGFMNPHFWLMLRSAMHKRIDCLRWISDTNYNPPNKKPNWLTTMAKTLPNFTRSYEYLVNNIDHIFNFMLNNAAFKTPEKRELVESIRELYYENIDDMYMDHIPIVHRKFFVVDHTPKGKYTDVSLPDVMNIVLAFTMAANKPSISDNQKNVVTGRVISMLADLYKHITTQNIGGKPGMFRKHVYGSRSHFTFRSVITSISGPHDYDEVHVPWSIGVTAYRPHLLNIMVKRMGYTYKNASLALFYAVNNYDKDVEFALNELIRLSRDGKLPIITHRNPTLHQGSALKVWITKFKSNPQDLTLSLSNLIVKLPNGDFDGDELNNIMLLDHMMADAAETLSPIFSVPSKQDPGEVGGLVSLPKTTVATIANYLNKEPQTTGEVTLDILPVEVEV